MEWDDPRNRIIMASGPMAGTVVSGSGTFSLVTKGPMTNLGVTTQANGFWGAFLKFAGYDAVVIQGQSPRWVYLHIGDGKAELRDASPILGKDTWEMEDAIRQDLGTTKRMSVFGIGPAGENKVRYAVVAGDKGHVCFKERLRMCDGIETSQGGRHHPGFTSLFRFMIRSFFDRKRRH